jgi:hypothetical protein
MSSDSIHDSTRYLVSELHYGSIMPGNRAEMLRDVYLQSGALIKGGVFANDLTVNGSGISIEGAVYCRNNIKMEYTNVKAGEDVTFGSTVVCPGTLLVPGNKIKTRFLSDLYLGKTNLKNCIVYGNIYSSSATIEDSIILGGIYCKNQLKIKNSIIFTFRAMNCELDNNVSILSPFGYAEKIKLNSIVNVLTFKNLFNADDELHNDGNIKLDETDIYEIELEKKEDATDLDVKKIQVLSVAERLLNTTDIIEHFKQNRNFIEFLSLNSHLSEEDKESFFKNNKQELEMEMWKIIENKSSFNDLEGHKSIEEMFELFNQKTADI